MPVPSFKSSVRKRDQHVLKVPIRDLTSSDRRRVPLIRIALLVLYRTLILACLTVTLLTDVGRFT